jgi:exosortase
MPDFTGATPHAKLVIGGTCLAAGIWAYFPTVVELAVTWAREPDYSHGFLVIPLALTFLWLRRSSFPGLSASSPLLGLALLAVTVAMRIAGARYFLGAVDGWSIVTWVGAVVAILGGRPLLWWCLPSIGFMIFMVPLPHRIEIELSAPLQRVATKLSTTALQLLGQPAFSEGNVILLGESRLGVAEACSGLRLFFSTLALSYAYLAIIRRPWWDKWLLAFATLPIAIISNSARIVLTALLYQLSDSVWVRKLFHDYFAGSGMILLTAGLFWLLLWYLSKLIREEEELDTPLLIRQSKGLALVKPVAASS